jgi:hypothetical protein
LEGRLEDGRCGLAARCTEGGSGPDFGPLLSNVVPDAGQSQASGVHGVPDRHAPERDQVARRRWYHTEREQQPERRHHRHPHGECNHHESTRDIPGQNLGAARLVAEPADLYLMAGTS